MNFPVGARLKEERNRLGLTQEEFASLSGNTRRTQTNYENNSRSPDADYLSSIAKAGADVGYILTGIRTSNPNMVADEVAGVLYVVESVLKREHVDVEPKLKAEFVLAAYKESTHDERQRMLEALEEGSYMLPLSVARIFGLKT